MEKTTKCACPRCHCVVDKSKAIIRQGKAYCSATCANDCTRTTCVCIHDNCDETDSQHKR